jgi:hypothetical protein
MRRAQIALSRPTDWRPLPIGLSEAQRSIAERESTAVTLRLFESTIIHGLLQTSEYARALLSVFQIQEHVVPDDMSNPAASIAEALSARVARQAILADSRRSFRFVMMEPALSNRFCPPTEMLGQIGRLRDINNQFDNVSIRIVPAGTRAAIPPLHGFELIDDRSVILDTFNASLISAGEADIRIYRQIFDSFERQSIAEIDSILREYQTHYRGLLLSEGT